jgi:hypothetical protein
MSPASCAATACPRAEPASTVAQTAYLMVVRMWQAYLTWLGEATRLGRSLGAAGGRAPFPACTGAATNFPTALRKLTRSRDNDSISRDVLCSATGYLDALADGGACLLIYPNRFCFQEGIAYHAFLSLADDNSGTSLLTHLNLLTPDYTPRLPIHVSFVLRSPNKSKCNFLPRGKRPQASKTLPNGPLINQRQAILIE